MPYIYLVQPVELVGTKRYKIGMSSLNNLNRIRSYKNGTRHLFICECADALYVERKLIEAFNKEYKLIGGREYFEVDCEMKMMNLFISIVMSYNNRMLPAAKPTTPHIDPTNKVITADKKNIDSSEDNKSVMTPMSWMNKFGYQSKSH